MNYLFLFFDSLTAALILPVRSEMAIHALVVFQGSNPHIIFITALFASIVGSSINWWIGKKLRFLKQSEALKHKAKEMKNAEEKWDKYLVWMLIFSPLKILGNPLSLLAGFLNTSFKKFLAIIFAGKFIYYFWLVYFN